MTPLRNFVIYLYGHGVPLVHLWPGQALVTSLESQSRDPWWIIETPPERVWTAALQWSYSDAHCSRATTSLYSQAQESRWRAGRPPQPHPLDYFTHRPPGSSLGLREFRSNYHSATSLTLLRFRFLPFSAPVLPNWFLSWGLSWVHNFCPNSKGCEGGKFWELGWLPWVLSSVAGEVQVLAWQLALPQHRSASVPIEDQSLSCMDPKPPPDSACTEKTPLCLHSKFTH